jgi:DNA-binding transcriptional ArsR family regulator
MTRGRRSGEPRSRRRWGGGDVFVALADPTRRQIIDLLSEGDKAVHELTATFAVTRPAISQHLRVLREAKLVHEHRVGRERHYQLRVAALREVSDWIARYDRFWDERLRALGRKLDELDALADEP